MVQGNRMKSRALIRPFPTPTYIRFEGYRSRGVFIYVLCSSLYCRNISSARWSLLTNSCRRPASDVRELTYRHERPLFFLINLQRMHPCNWYASLPHSTCLARRYHIGNNARLFLSPPPPSPPASSYSSSSTAKRVSYESLLELTHLLPASPLFPHARLYL